MKRINGGFTLVEVMISSVIMVVLAASVMGLSYIVSNSQLTAINSYTAVEEANAIISSITAEVRTAEQSATGAYPLEVADDNEIVFYSDIDYDGVVERVRYTATGKRLEKGVVDPTGVPLLYDLATEKVTTRTEYLDDSSATPVFLYFNGDWPTDTANNPLLSGSRLSNTRLLRVTIKMRMMSDTTQDTFTLETHVQPRTLKTNL
jgi:prepilin-type N-terminal cleavage/methylation domain-containing protein